MKSHAERGERICRNVRSLAPVLPVIRSHHERWDGSGYPDGLKREEIPLLARIIQIADIYDALTTIRPYKRALSSEQAIRIMHEETAKGWRDPNLMQVFLQLVPLFNSPAFNSPESVELPHNSLQALATAIGHHRADPFRATPGVVAEAKAEVDRVPVSLGGGV
jgi:putative two-component system response regulator